MTMKGWIGRLIGKKEPPPRTSFSIPAPKGYPMSPRLKRPVLKGLSKQERAEALATYNNGMRRHFAATATFERLRCVALGVTEYVWVAMPDERCDIARLNNGRTFSYKAPPPEGHVCEGECHSADWCRCFAKPKIAGFS